MAQMSGRCDLKWDKKGAQADLQIGRVGGWYKTERQHSEEQKVNMEGAKWIKGAYGERSRLRFQAYVD